MDEQMLQYIRTRKSVRVPDDMIRQELQGVGWDAASIDAAFASLVPTPPPESTPPPAPPPISPTTPQTQTAPAAAESSSAPASTTSAPATPTPQPPATPATPATTPESAPVATPEPAAQPTPTTSASASSAATPPVESAAATAQPQAAPSGAKRILLVEDEKALATVMSLKLKNAGYDVVVVYNGDDALRTLGGSYFDLMLVDIMMPKRDGFSVLEELKKQNNQIPVFAMSNLGQEEDIARVKSMGVKEYIVKADASPTDILGRVDAFLKH